MEIRFMPSLANDKNLYGFILNMQSAEAQNLLRFDVNTDNFPQDFKKQFCLQNSKSKGKGEVVLNYMHRASYIILGVNRCFIEGILVGRAIENNKRELQHVKKLFPHCYICNVDGKVIIE